MMPGPVAVVLAAGKAKRMKSRVTKVLHPVAGRAMLCYVMDAVRGLDPERVVVVVGDQAEEVRSLLGPHPVYVEQRVPQGTGHAVMQAAATIAASPASEVLVVCADVPTLTVQPLQKLLALHRTRRPAASVLTARPEKPTGLGRIVRSPEGRVLRIVEESDATSEELTITEVNTGIYCFERDALLAVLSCLTPNNAQGEYYLTDVVAVLGSQGGLVLPCEVDDPSLVRSVNNRLELAEAERVLRSRIVHRLMEEGVTVVDPASTFVDAGVEVGPDTVLYPFTLLEGTTRVGSDCRLGPGARLIDTVVEDGAVVSLSVLESSRVGRRVQVGPFAHLRAGTVLAEGVRVGNFAELKNSSIGEGTRVPHHSYIGDATVGPGANIGAGVVVVNYDGRQKHRTEIGAKAFVGCNANLVAPVRLAPGSYVAAGSTITRDVPAGALGVGRARQVNVEGWVARQGFATPVAEDTGTGEPK